MLTACGWCGALKGQEGREFDQLLQDSIEHPARLRAQSGRRWAKLLAAGLVVVGAAQDVEQFMDAGVVALFGAVDRLLREVVAQDVAGVGGMHACAPLCRVAVASRRTRAA